MRILIIGGISQSLVNFRGPLIRAMLEKGHEVLACAGEPQQIVADTLCKWGVRFIPVSLARAGMRPLEDLRTLFELRRIIRKFRPEAVLAYTIKPVIWGSLAARMAGVKNFYSLITGLGYAFIDGTSLKQWLASWIAKHFYAISLKGSRKVFFQNSDDRDLFVNLSLVKPDQTVVVEGSGIDLDFFTFSPISKDKNQDMVKRRTSSISSHIHVAETSQHNAADTKTGVPSSASCNPVRFLLIARLLRHKGICEYAAAAAMVRQAYPQAEFHLVGDYDPNPAGLKPVEIEKWTNAGTLIYHGRQDDVRRFLKEAHVYVLPSYREGTPRTVLEAMATGRPVITTDAPGCRETVKLTAKGLEQRKNNDAVMESENGFLVRPHDAAAVAIAMRKFLDNPGLISIMGHRSREIAEAKYDVHKVNAVILEFMGLM